MITGEVGWGGVIAGNGRPIPGVDLGERPSRGAALPGVERRNRFT
jgi:hypothetical protein